MFAELGLSVLAADLDPQANLSSMFLDEDTLEAIWTEPQTPRTVVGSLTPLVDGTGDVSAPWIAEVAPGIGLVVGDLALSARVEDELCSRWPDCLERKPIAFRVITAFWRLLAKAAAERQADVVLIDVAPSLGALNRAALIAASHVVIPLVPDLYSIQGLNNLGPTLRGWRKGWQERLERVPETLRTEPLPSGAKAHVSSHPCGWGAGGAPSGCPGLPEGVSGLGQGIGGAVWVALALRGGASQGCQPARILRWFTACRNAHSAALLVGSMPSISRKVQRASLCLRSWPQVLTVQTQGVASPRLQPRSTPHCNVTSNANPNRLATSPQGVPRVNPDPFPTFYPSTCTTRPASSR